MMDDDRVDIGGIVWYDAGMIREAPAMIYANDPAHAMARVITLPQAFKANQWLPLMRIAEATCVSIREF